MGADTHNPTNWLGKQNNVLVSEKINIFVKFNTKAILTLTYIACYVCIQISQNKDSHCNATSLVCYILFEIFSNQMPIQVFSPFYDWDIFLFTKSQAKYRLCGYNCKNTNFRNRTILETNARPPNNAIFISKSYLRRHSFPCKIAVAVLVYFSQRIKFFRFVGILTLFMLRKAIESEIIR